jgi:hypothetical protein
MKFKIECSHIFLVRRDENILKIIDNSPRVVSGTEYK